MEKIMIRARAHGSSDAMIVCWLLGVKLSRADDGVV